MISMYIIDQITIKVIQVFTKLYVLFSGFFKTRHKNPWLDTRYNIDKNFNVYHLLLF